MGGGAWTGATYSAQNSARLAAGYKTQFDHDEDIRAGRKAAEIHPLNDPRKKAGPGSPNEGRVVREVCITEEHPDPTAIAVGFDVTGSMGALPRGFQARLPQLNKLLRDDFGVADAQILFGAIGDARTDHFPLQVGQFESDNRSDEQLSKLYLEGNGGGQGSETYELFALYLHAAAVMDPFEANGKKGYLFTAGDERPAGKVQRSYEQDRCQYADPGRTFATLTGMPLEDDVDAGTVVALATEKFHWFHFVVDSTRFGGMYRTSHSLGAWRELLGDRAAVLGEPEALPSAIAATVAVMEGNVDLDGALYDLRQTGTDLVVADAVGSALATV